MVRIEFLTKIYCDAIGYDFSVHGPGKNKRQWNEEEDDYLVGVVKDLITSGTFKADNGFKPGLPNAVEEQLKSKLPNSGLKA